MLVLAWLVLPATAALPRRTAAAASSNPAVTLDSKAFLKKPCISNNGTAF